MATNTSTNYISVRRNRDYSKKFNWTETLKQDVYNFYLTAREDPRKGFMQRMKNLWDAKYPMHSHITQRNLREQAVFVEKGMQRQSEPRITPDREDHQNNDDVINTVENVSTELNSESKTLFDDFLTETSRVNLSDRKFSTKVQININEDTLRSMNNIIQEYITNKENLTYFDMNCIHYAAAISILHKYGKQKEFKHSTKKTPKKPWIIESENQINSLRKKISHVTVVLDTYNRRELTSNQKKLHKQVKKLCGNLKQCTLTSKLAKLKHDLKARNLKLKDDITKAKRSSINHQFLTNQKAVYRNWKSKAIEIKNAPSPENIKNFWGNIWEKDTPTNLDTQWYRDLKTTYCTDVTSKNYVITRELFDQYISKIPNSKAPGADKITGYWIKKLTALHNPLFTLLRKTQRGEIEMPAWLIRSKTILLPKNSETNQEKNYRPIACLNTTYKLYTGILNSFIQDHCTTNDIITIEQAGGKKGSWGCPDQLLINKMILEEVHTNRRNLFTMWFDYRKAFDSISHRWLFEALKLAKVPDNIISNIKSLATKWATEIHLQTSESITITDIITYLTGVLQGDCLSLLLFILCLNPLSHLINLYCDGYSIGPSGKRLSKLTHLFFVDDLKTYAKNLTDAKKQLKVITEFSNDIGMKFGGDKCAFLTIERGVRKIHGNNICVNGLEISELKTDDSYKYLGLDEDISYKGELNKERVAKEYFTRIRKIWNSELYAKNKVQAHNVFAVPVLTGTFGVLDWTKDEISNIDIKTRKLLTCTGNFHRNSNVDRLYTTRDNGGRGLNSVYDVFITRLLSLIEHLNTAANSHKFLNLVLNHEKDRLVRVTHELQERLGLPRENAGNTTISTQAKQTIKQNHLKAWHEKKQHGFVVQKQHAQPEHDKYLSNSWLNLQGTISHSEGYIFAIQEQEINTRALQSKRQHPGDQTFNKKCRYCHSKLEDIFHLICSCERLSASLYLPVRHNEVGKTLYNEIIKLKDDTHQPIIPPPILNTNEIEIWWDIHIRTVPSVEHNKPDIVVWEKDTKTCKIIDICVPLDENVLNQEKKKNDTYVQLAIGLARLYPDYQYKIIPIVLGATGLVTKSLVKNMKELSFDDARIKQIIPKLQRKALIGTMRIMKSAMTMRK